MEPYHHLERELGRERFPRKASAPHQSTTRMVYLRPQIPELRKNTGPSRSPVQRLIFVPKWEVKKERREKGRVREMSSWVFNRLNSALSQTRLFLHSWDEAKNYSDAKVHSHMHMHVGPMYVSAQSACVPPPTPTSLRKGDS